MKIENGRRRKIRFIEYNGETNMKIENWCGYKIRFIEYNGEWWAVLKDICDALELRTDKVSSRLEEWMIEKVIVTQSDNPSKGVRKKQNMIIVNELGIYEALFASRKPEAKAFRVWNAKIMQKLRKFVGLDGHQVFEMTSPDVQEKINDILDTLYWDEEQNRLMRSVTTPGGDVDQVPFDI